MSDIDNGQHWLDRNRPPRVQITYDVETGDAVQKKELPLVVGILAHLNRDEVTGLDKRQFASIDRDNFNEVMLGLKPTIMIDGAPVEFTHMDQFHPLGLLKHKDLPDLAKLYEERQKLRDMLAKLDGNALIEGLLSEAISAGAAPQSDAPPDESPEAKAKVAQEASLEAKAAAARKEVLDRQQALQDAMQASDASATELSEATAAQARAEREEAELKKLSGAAENELKQATQAVADANKAIADNQAKLDAATGTDANDAAGVTAALQQATLLVATLMDTKARVARAQAKLDEAQAMLAPATALANGARDKSAATLAASKEKAKGLTDALAEFNKPPTDAQ